jgi:hypothetical protein
MSRITLKVQQPAGEVECHIDRANGAPAVEAAICCDYGANEIDHGGYAFWLSFSSSHAAITRPTGNVLESRRHRSQKRWQGLLFADFSLTRTRRTVLAQFGRVGAVIASDCVDDDHRGGVMSGDVLTGPR